MGFWTRQFVREVIRQSHQRERYSRQYKPQKGEKKILGFTKGEWNQSGLKTIGLLFILFILVNLVSVHIGS